MAVALAPSLAKVVDSHSANAVPPVITNITAELWDTCALSLSGEVYCWGNSSYGKLGSYVPDGSFPAPILDGEIPQGIEVKFNDTVVTCSPLTSTSFEITVPAHAPGYADVSIANAFGEITTLVDGYLYVDSTEPTDPVDPTPTEDSAATPAAPATGIGKIVSLEVIVLALVSFAIGAVGLTRRKIA